MLNERPENKSTPYGESDRRDLSGESFGSEAARQRQPDPLPRLFQLEGGLKAEVELARLATAARLLALPDGLELREGIQLVCRKSSSGRALELQVRYDNDCVTCYEIDAASGRETTLALTALPLLVPGENGYPKLQMQPTRIGIDELLNLAAKSLDDQS